jgi:tetratricopeptide (TPR) repeat protein
VTLGRALLALGQLPEAQRELEAVLRVAPENIAARRDLGELFRREDRLPEALAQLRSALALAPQDAELAASVDALERSVSPQVEPVQASAPGPVHSPEAVPHASGMVFTTNAVIDAPPSVQPLEASRMLARLEGWLARLEADRRNRDGSTAGE